MSEPPGCCWRGGGRGPRGCDHDRAWAWRVGCHRMMTVGVAAAPIFPLLTLTTAQRSGAANVMKTTRTVSFQVAAATIGGAALPAGMGLAIGAWNAKVLAPSLLVLGLAMCGVFWVMSSLVGRASST